MKGNIPLAEPWESRRNGPRVSGLDVELQPPSGHGEIRWESTSLITLVTVRRERQGVSFGQPRHQPPRQFRTVQQRDTTEQRPDSEQQERDAHQGLAGQQGRNTIELGRDPSNKNGIPIKVHVATRTATPLSRKRLRIAGTRPRSAAIRPAGQQHRSAAP